MNEHGGTSLFIHATLWDQRGCQKL